MLSEDEANAVMYDIMCLSEIDPESAMLEHLYELHKLRDQQTWIDLSDKVYSDYYAAEAALDAWRELHHA